MNRSEEKNHIYSMMQDITNERSRLTDVYVSLLGRLNDLDKAEKAEKIEEANKEESNDTGEDEDETEEIEETPQSLLESAITLDDTPKEPLFKVSSLNSTESMADIVNRHNSQLENEDVIEKADIIPKTEIAKEKDKIPKRASYLDTDKVTGYIVTVLKKAGQPLSSKEIYTRINAMTDYEIKKSNFTSNLLPRAIKKNKRIAKAMRGYYQYSTTV